VRYFWGKVNGKWQRAEGRDLFTMPFSGDKAR